MSRVGGDTARSDFAASRPSVLMRNVRTKTHFSATMSTIEIAPSEPDDGDAMETGLEIRGTDSTNDEQRFLLDLEFVQALANIDYLTCACSCSPELFPSRRSTALAELEAASRRRLAHKAPCWATFNSHFYQFFFLR